METETHFSREVVKVLKENAVADRTWSSVKLFELKNSSAFADRDVPLAVKNL